MFGNKNMNRIVLVLTVLFMIGIGMPLAPVCQADDSYPAKPITLVIPYGKGGGSDRTYHAIKPGLDKHLGVETNIKRVGGKGGTVGASFASKMPADGYHIFLSPAGPVVIQPHLRKLDYNYDNFEPICRITQAPVGFMVNGDSKYNTLQEVIDDAKANPDKLAYASSGYGTVPHIVMEAFNLATNTKMRHIPQGGGSKKVVQVVKDGKAQVFALWFGLYAPKGTPQKIIEKLDCACAKSLHEPEVINNMAKEKNTIKYMGGKELNAFVDSEYLKNKKFVANAGLTGSVK